MVNREKKKREVSPITVPVDVDSSDLEFSKGHAPTLYQRLFRARQEMGFYFLVTMLAVWFVMQQSQKPLDPKANTPNGIQQARSVSDEKVEQNPTNDCQWRPEPLLGVCDTTKSSEHSKFYKTAIECENACCAIPTCTSFQFRQKEGCQWGDDTRLGSEGDGPIAWCEPRPPAKWSGQRIAKEEDGTRLEGACTDSGWNPDELQGQCFGLGPRRTAVAGNTPEACRDACCAKPECGMWQWGLEAGCFFSKSGFSCQEANPVDFEPFYGKRKVVEGKSYSPNAYSGDYADMDGKQK
jgi:hypothetical protein